MILVSDYKINSFAVLTPSNAFSLILTRILIAAWWTFIFLDIDNFASTAQYISPYVSIQRNSLNCSIEMIIFPISFGLFANSAQIKWLVEIEFIEIALCGISNGRPKKVNF